MTAPATPARRRIRPLAGAAMAVVFVLAGSAAAQPFPTPPEPAKPPENPAEPAVDRPVVGVIDLRANKESEAIARALVAAIGARPELQRVKNSRVEESLVANLEDEDSRSVTSAREQLAQAREQMANFQLGLAIDRAQNGRDELIAVMPTPATNALLADLVFTEGQAYFANQQKDQARKAFALVHQLTPGRALDPNSYLPELVDAFAAAGQPPAGQATLEITATGTVYLDGREQGQGKQTLRVPPGAHIVVAVGPELRPSGKRIAVAAGQTLAIDLPKREASSDTKTSRARKALIAAPDPTARAGAMKQIAELAQLTDAVIVTSDAKGNPAIQLWRNRAPGFQEIKPISRTLTPAEADKIIAPLVPRKPDPVDDTPGPVIPFKPPETPKEWYEKRWVQVGLVGGAIAVVAGMFWVRDAIGADSRPLGDVLDEAPVGRE